MTSTIRRCVPADHTTLGALRIIARTRTVVASAMRTYDSCDPTVIEIAAPEHLPTILSNAMTSYDESAQCGPEALTLQPDISSIRHSVTLRSCPDQVVA
jgi:TPP-dependent trihydroxycyclohexane-1,2-dione (THcHDO) dehydratase